MKKISLFILLILVLMTTSSCRIIKEKIEEKQIEKIEREIDINSRENMNLSTNQYLDKVLKLQYSGVYNADSRQDLGLSYRDPETKKAYTENKFSSFEDGNVRNYYKNNVMHVESYFDIELKLVVSETKNEKGETVTSLQYIFFFYNMDYTKMGIESANEAQERIRIVFVEGVNSKHLLDYTDDEILEGDAALEEMLTKLDDESDYTGTPSVIKFSFSAEFKNASFYYPVRDKNAIINPEKMEESEAFIQKLNLSIGVNYNNEYFDDMESTTFSIILLNDDGEVGFTNLVEGTKQTTLKIDDIHK